VRRGIVAVPLLVLFLDLPECVATATSLAGVVVCGVRRDIDVGYAALVGNVCFRLRGSDGVRLAWDVLRREAAAL
jgi:hypothetical protein